MSSGTPSSFPGCIGTRSNEAFNVGARVIAEKIGFGALQIGKVDLNVSIYTRCPCGPLLENAGAAGKPPNCCSPKGLRFHVGDLIC